MTGIRAFDELFSDRDYISLKNYLYNYLIRRHAVRKILRDKRQERILEVGSGISPMTAAREFPLVVYSDVSFSSLHILKGSGAGGVYTAADGAGLPFRDGAFAAVVCSEVLEHVKDDAQALQEIARVLRPEGTLIVTFPHRKFYFSRDDRFVHHYRRYEGKEMEDLMQQAGLKPVFTCKLLGPLEKATMIIAVSVFPALKTIIPECKEGSAGQGLPRFLKILFVVVNRFYAGLAWLDGQLFPRCLASVLLIKAVKTH
jgi:ubiquinone/menaquinone biosynthesis C-methylase UbiE